MKKNDYNIDKIYNPKKIEKLLYQYWEQQGYFKASGKLNIDENKESFCIMIPPPNITGSLHMGHAFQQTIMDIIIRYQRMQGKNTLWQMGTDHAGIATQMVVERKIMIEEGKTRHDYGREAFINKIWKWKEEFGSTITHQMRRLGNSLDWQRERFTMDKRFSNSVTEVFIRLYKDNLIYRGKRLVNWDPKLRTAISDLEVENRLCKGSLWYLCYPLADGIKTISGEDHLVVATTRPETLLGDTAVAVNPKDSRYQNLVGKRIILPLTGRRIPIISDENVEMRQGSGCVKITPAHDFNDFNIGKRHNLPMINIFTLDASIRNQAEVFDMHGDNSQQYGDVIPIQFQGLERFSARKLIIAELQKLGLLSEIKVHNLTLPYGDRSGVIIEPLLTDQWYVRTAPLAKAAISAVKNREIQFVSKQYENMYYSWMQDIKDWCISRQLWWGHRIPVWYDIHGKFYVGHDETSVRLEYKLAKDLPLRQEVDVLDTWFSSGLWTFSTLGWPEKTADLKMFHPTNVIVSGFDIIFFWIARMIMLTLYLFKDDRGKTQVPFKIVYMTGLIRDDEGQKMSKSKGNVLDPLDMIDGISLADLLEKRTDNMMQPKLAKKIRQRTEKQFPLGIEPHGTDALRFTLAALASTGRDINWDMKRLSGYRNFCNKLWNASRFVLMNIKGKDCSQLNKKVIELSLADRWILSEFNHTVKIYRNAIDTYRFDLAATILYEFIWDKFCDWYLELTKSVINNSSNNITESVKYTASNTLINVLEAVLRLAHPIIPYITETLWKKVKILKGINGDSIMLQPFPQFNSDMIDKAALKDMEWVKKLVNSVRNIRAEMNISSGKPLSLLLRNSSPDVYRRVTDNKYVLKSLCRLNAITFLKDEDKVPISVIKLVEEVEILIPMSGFLNKTSEIERLEKDMIKLVLEIERIEIKLANENFITRAPKEVVRKERSRLISCIQDKEKLLAQKTMITQL